MSACIFTNEKIRINNKINSNLIGLTAGSGLLIPATYASFHPVTTGEIADNTILSSDIRNGEVRNSDIETSAVTSGKISDTAGVYSVDIVNGTVRSVDIGDGQVASADILDGTITSTDLAYDAIQLTRVEGNPVTVAPGRGGAAYADCPPGQVVTGGGFGANRAGPYLPAVNIITNYPHDLDTWYIGGLNEGNVVVYFQAFAVCVKGQGNFVAPIVNSTSALQN